ncbi:hypothetical protein [Nonomuraea diastatica]|uniref:Uncharacterized protein n=1 Tax=Nonomuraea diastatica TaxID=1848329 RepID=A0A4R4WXB4_9ACTN|nr:hypothetical protein [Nonomuraea diastatica]TDD22332.1 hypothetical protein E1294_11835 [Nonomuraea diastatica]
MLILSHVIRGLLATWHRRRNRPPKGFPAAGLDLYDSEDHDHLYVLGHVSSERMTAAVAEYIRHIHFPPDAVVNDPLTVLDGGANRVRATIRQGYATFDLRRVGWYEFSARLFVEPGTRGAWPITYWPGEFG